MILTSNWSHTCSAKKAAGILHKSPSTLGKWRRTGRGPLYRKNGSRRIEYSLMSIYDYDRRTTAVDAAAYLGVSTARLGSWRKRGYGPAFKEERGVPVYHSDDILEYEDIREARSDYSR